MERFTIAATGHRPNKLFGYNLLDSRWVKLGHIIREFLLKMLKEHGSLTCISGMALGVDQLYALVALKLRDEGHDIRVLAALPCHGQNSVWKSDEYWQNILQRADEKIYVHDGPYTKTCLTDRNHWMVEHSDIIMAVWDGTTGGTSNCVRDANKCGVPVHNLYAELQAALQ